MVWWESHIEQNNGYSMPMWELNSLQSHSLLAFSTLDSIHTLVTF